VKIWNVKSGLNEKTFESHSESIISVEFSGNGLKASVASSEISL
jgi:WD40 repeat protein